MNLGFSCRACDNMGMLEWLHPHSLWLLLTVPLFIWGRRRRYCRALLFSDIRLVEGLPVRGRAWSGWFGPWWFGMTIFAFLLALAGPRLPDLRTRLPSAGIAILIVVDASPTMRRPDAVAKPGDTQRISRLEAARAALDLFVRGGRSNTGVELRGRPNDLIGIVAFAERPRTICPLTLSHGVALNALAEPNLGKDLGDSTNVGDGIAAGLIELDRLGSIRKVLILVSDGQHEIAVRPEGSQPRSDTSREKPLFPRQAAQLAANLRIPIYAIDPAGPPNSNPQTPGEKKEAEDRRAGMQTLAAVAELSGGKVFAADDAEGMNAAFAAIDRLEKTPLLSYRYRRYHEGRPILLLIGFVMLIGGLTLERTYLRRIP